MDPISRNFEQKRQKNPINHQKGHNSGKRVRMENLTIMTIFSSICVHIHVFDFKKIDGPM